MTGNIICATRSLSRRVVSLSLTRFLIPGILVGALAIAASGYTLVLRGGRRVEIPSKFTLTKNTITYEAAPTVNVTLLLAVVDVAATERANNESAGSFFKHSEQNQTVPAVSETRRAQVTVTNRNLEPVRRTRVESELAYEKRRKDLGLPTIEESRRRQAQEEAETAALIRRRDLAQSDSEAYWRERASALRTEIVAVDAEINFLRSRLGDYYQFPLATHSLVTGVLPLVPLRNRSAVVPPRVGPSGVFTAPGIGPQLTGRMLFGGGSTRGQAFVNRGASNLHLARPVPGFGFPFGFSSGAISAFDRGPFDYVEGAYEREALSERLDSLLVTRAGLAAQWTQLEDEARDAHVPQIWLEP